jgi:hypothetical protein
MHEPFALLLPVPDTRPFVLSVNDGEQVEPCVKACLGRGSTHLRLHGPSCANQTVTSGIKSHARLMMSGQSRWNEARSIYISVSAENSCSLNGKRR